MRVVHITSLDNDVTGRDRIRLHKTLAVRIDLVVQILNYINIQQYSYTLYFVNSAFGIVSSNHTKIIILVLWSLL